MDLLDILYERLLTALPVDAGNQGDRRLTVGDLYQRHIPYRAVRAQVGVMELAEYEHALLRLLSGERRYLEVADREVRLEIERELGSPNPILGIYRDYPGAEVRIVDPAGGAGRVGGPGPGGGTEVVGSRTDGRATRIPPGHVESHRATTHADSAASKTVSDPPLGPKAADRQPLVPRPVPTAGPASVPQRASKPTTGRRPCGSCGKGLPDVAGLVFCPFCGTPQGPVACGRCGTPVERGWSYCVRCGAPAPALP